MISDRRTVDAVDLHERVAAGGAFPFRLFSEVEFRAGRAVERFFVFTCRTVMGDFEAHAAGLEPRCVKILVHRPPDFRCIYM